MPSFNLRTIVAAGRLIGLFLLLFGPSPAWGQQPTSPSSSDSTAQPQSEATVILMFEPHAADSLALVGSIAAHLAGVPVRLIHDPRPRTELLSWLGAGRARAKATRALGLFAVDVSRRDGWRLFFLEPDGVPTLIRRLETTPEHAPLDEAGITVRLLVEALLDGKHVEVTEPVLREEPAEAGLPRADDPSRLNAPSSGPSSSGPSAAQPGAAEPEGSRRSRQGGGRSVHPAALVGLSTTKWLSGQGWQSGVLTGAGLYLDRAWSLSIDYVWYQKLRYRSSDATITLSRHPFTGRVSYRPSPGLSPVFSLGAWFDAISRETLESTVGYQGTPSVVEPSWGMNAGVALSSPRLSILSLRMDLGLDVAARSVSYVVQDTPAKSVLATNTLRPSFAFVLDFRL